MSATAEEEIQVLHVDDEPDFTDLTRTFLEREDTRFTVDTVTSADRGLEVIDDGPPDCVVSDYNMPGMDGLEFLQAARETCPDLPFILFTGKGSETVASDAISAGATDYLQKQSGTDQYSLLANRILNAVTQYRSEQRLRETRNEYTAVFENAQNALLLVDVEDDGFRYQQCNPRAVELIGRDRTDIVGEPPREALGPENGTKVVGAYRKCVRQRESVAYTVTLALPIGRVIRECEVTPVSSEGNIEQLVVEFRDITEQRERLRELEEYGTIIEALTDAVYVLDEAGRFTYVNDEFVNLVGYDRETILGNTPSLVKDDEAVERGEHELGRLLSSDGPTTVTFEVMVQPCDGDQIVCEDHMGVLPYEGAQFNGSVGTLRDITARKDRQQELAQFRDLMSNMEELADVGAWEYDPETDRLMLTDGVRRIHGLDSDAEFTLEAAFDTFHPDDRDLLEDRFDTCLETGEPYEIDVRLTTPDGERRWVTARGERVTDDESGDVVRGCTQDITEQRELEAELSEILGRISDAFFALDEAFRVTHVNSRGEELLEASEDELLGETLWNTYPEIEGSDGMWDSVRTAMDTQDSVSLEFHSDPTDRWYDVTVYPSESGVSVYFRDVTDRKNREQELRELKSQYETLAENFPDGAVFLIDTDLNCVRARGEELSNVGLSPDDVEGAKPHALFPEDIADELCHYYEEALDGNANTFEQEYEGDRYRIQTVPVRADDEETDYVMAVSQNITEDAEDKQNLERQNERLEEFASIVSHDLRSPLTVAAGTLELAQETCESDHLERAADALDRSQALIDDLLTLAQEGEDVAAVDSVALADVAERSWQTAETAQAALETDATRAIRADRSRLQQLFENLYRNAVEHSSDGVTVSVGEMDDGFYVADSGSGIPEAEREEVFEAGYSTNEHGTGFGLRIVKQIAEAHGWAVTVTESEHGGARFEVTGVEFADR